MTPGRVKKVYDTLLIVFFLALISIPFITSLATREEQWSEAEKRVLQPFPTTPATIKDIFLFPQNFEKYFNDHFGFRELMVFRYHQEMEKRFDMAGTPLVVKGKGKWLFYTADQMLEDFRGEIPLSKKDLAAWHQEQLKSQQWLQQRGIHYLSFSPPNKQTIYPEFLPKDYLTVKGITRMEQLHDFLVQNPLPHYLNVYDVLKKAKSQRKLYYYTDTHWNQYGAYVCFQNVMKRVQELFPHEQFLVDFPFHRNSRLTPGGDLARMLMIDRKVNETNPKMRYRKSCSEETVLKNFPVDSSTPDHERPLHKKCSSAKLKAIVFSDSFIDFLEPFLSENFSEIVYLREKFSPESVEMLLDNFEPDIVFEELVERNYFR